MLIFRHARGEWHTAEQLLQRTMSYDSLWLLNSWKQVIFRTKLSLTILLLEASWGLVSVMKLFLNTQFSYTSYRAVGKSSDFKPRGLG